MNYEDFSKKDLADLLSLVHGATVCTTEASFKSLLGGLKDLVEADLGVCALGNSRGEILGAVNLSYPEEWLAKYMAEDLGSKDPVVLYSRRAPGAFFWADSLNHYRGKEQMDFLRIAAEFDLCHGLAGAVQSPEKGVSSLFSFSGDRNRFTDRHLKILDMVTPHLHQALVRSVIKNRASSLTDRELEVLEQMKRGISYSQIAINLNVSLSTVKYHVSNIKDKLEAVNKAHAIAIAAEMEI